MRLTNVAIFTSFTIRDITFPTSTPRDANSRTLVDPCSRYESALPGRDVAKGRLHFSRSCRDTHVRSNYGQLREECRPIIDIPMTAGCIPRRRLSRSIHHRAKRSRAGTNASEYYRIFARLSSKTEPDDPARFDAKFIRCDGLRNTERTSAVYRRADDAN